MFEFIKLQYQMGRITQEQVAQHAAAGWITKEQAAEITGGEESDDSLTYPESR